MIQPLAVIVAGCLALAGVVWSQYRIRATEFEKQRRQMDVDATIDAIQALVRLSQTLRQWDGAPGYRRKITTAVTECEAETVRLAVLGRGSTAGIFDVTEYVDRVLEQNGRSALTDEESERVENLVRTAIRAIRAEVDDTLGPGEPALPGAPG